MDAHGHSYDLLDDVELPKTCFVQLHSGSIFYGKKITRNVRLFGIEPNPQEYGSFVWYHMPLISMDILHPQCVDDLFLLFLAQCNLKRQWGKSSTEKNMRSNETWVQAMYWRIERSRSNVVLLPEEQVCEAYPWLWDLIDRLLEGIEQRNSKFSDSQHDLKIDVPAFADGFGGGVLHMPRLEVEAGEEPWVFTGSTLVDRGYERCAAYCNDIQFEKLKYVGNGSAWGLQLWVPAKGLMQHWKDNDDPKFEFYVRNDKDDIDQKAMQSIPWFRSHFE